MSHVFSKNVIFRLLINLANNVCFILILISYVNDFLNSNDNVLKESYFTQQNLAIAGLLRDIR